MRRVQQEGDDARVSWPDLRVASSPVPQNHDPSNRNMDLTHARFLFTRPGAGCVGSYGPPDSCKCE